MSKLQYRALTENIILIKAESQHDLNRTFMRFQEHYESPEYKGKIFTIGEFRSWYSQTYGANTYERDWSGFNVPSTVFKPFNSGLFDPLTELEEELVSLFKYRQDNFYVIGVQDWSNLSILHHEIGHALYHTDKEYRELANKLIKKLDTNILVSMRSWIIKKGYHESVVDDETQAYLTCNLDMLSARGVLNSQQINKLNNNKLLKQLKNIILNKAKV